MLPLRPYHVPEFLEILKEKLTPELFVDLLAGALKRKNDHIFEFLLQHKPERGIVKITKLIEFCDLKLFVKLIDDYGFSFDVHSCCRAAQVGKLDILRVLHEKYKCSWNWRVCTAAAEGGHLECLIYAHEKGCPWDSDTCTFAARNGHLACLIYAHENRCEWDGGTLVWAEKNGHLDCLEYAHKNGCRNNFF